MSEVPVNVLKNAAVEYLRSQGLLPPSRGGAAMRRRWATEEHRAKIDASVERRLADPAALAAMRARIEQARVSRGDVASAISAARWRKHGWGGFASNDDLTKFIIAEYERGQTARQIAIAVDMAHNSVCRRIRLAGIELPARGFRQRHVATTQTRLRKCGITDISSFDVVVAALYAEGGSGPRYRRAPRSQRCNDLHPRTSLNMLQ